MEWYAQLQMIGTVALAMLLGGVIGIEREMADRPAGFRTHMLVAGSASLLVALADPLLEHFGRLLQDEAIRADPLRVVEAIITGVSFLGAGTIFRSRNGEQVQGLTTAASILLSAGIGIGVALGLYVLAVGIAALTLFVLRGLRWTEQWLGNSKRSG